MTEWTVVGVIIALAGLFATVGAPILKLNRNIVELNMTMKSQAERMDRLERGQLELASRDHESHQRLWDHNSEQDRQLADHETRIKVLEEKE